jgi:hypothetical protein
MGSVCVQERSGARAAISPNGKLRESPSNLRIGLPQKLYWENLDTEVESATREALENSRPELIKTMGESVILPARSRARARTSAGGGVRLGFLGFKNPPSD